MPTRTYQENLAAVERARPAVERARAIRHKYDPLFWRQPNVWSVGIGKIRDENGEWDGTTIGFKIWVTEKVEQSALPPEDRIPNNLEGVPVQIQEVPMSEFYNEDEINSRFEESTEEECNGQD